LTDGDQVAVAQFRGRAARQPLPIVLAGFRGKERIQRRHHEAPAMEKSPVSAR
jgi:hypothetical protein